MTRRVVRSIEKSKTEYVSLVLTADPRLIGLTKFDPASEKSGVVKDADFVILSGSGRTK
jgi:hypothetical protein